MAAYGFFGTLWLTRLSTPTAERVVHRHVLRARPARMLEIGLGTLVRTERMLRAAAGRRPGETVAYVGIDRFEGRLPSDPPGVSLKEAHRRLNGLARVQLVPGNADTALARVCNQLGAFDMVVISADTDERHLERCWFFLQRITGPQTAVLVEGRGSGATWTTVAKPRIDELAARAVQGGLRQAG